jgi:diguanylate cyclase (GGDEF)-like protein
MIALFTGKRIAGLAASLEKAGFLKKSWRLLLLWPLVALLLIAIGWTALLEGLDRRRNEIEQSALAQVAALSRSYADRVARVTEIIDRTILHVKYDWQVSGGRFRLEDLQDLGVFPPSSSFYIAIVDHNGMLLTSTFRNVQNINVIDFSFFLVQQSDMQSLYIAPPIFGRLSDRNIIPFARALENTSGGFSGVIVVTVVPDYFTGNYDESVFGKHGLLSVVGTDGVARATRVGNTVQPPETTAFVALPDFKSPRGSALVNGKTSFKDKRDRYIGWHAVQGYPLVALAGLDREEILGPYRITHAAAMRYAIAATSALAIFTMIAIGLTMRLAWRKRQMELTQATYRMATEEGNEGFFIGRPVYDDHGAIVDFLAIDCNQRGAELLNMRREEVIGNRLSHIYQASSLQQRVAAFARAMETGFLDAELEEPDDTPLNARWVHLKAIRSEGDLAITLRDISDTKAHVAELERRGNEDALTGLPNRHWIQGYLPQAIKHAAAKQEMLALLFVDLDGFKAVNDAMGHAAGDELLQNAARRLKLAVRPHDKVVRLGGDEFVVIIDRIHHTSDAAHVAERILHAFQESFRLPQGTHSVGTSIGISTYPSDGPDAETLLEHADIAMYSVKTSGKGNYRFYDQKFYDALRARLERENDLGNAVEFDQFVMYYQPRVETATGTITSMEALVRWAHPTKGMLSPIEFIALAEETGLIVELGQRVIEKVCAQLAYWSRTGQQLVPVSINVSPRQFLEGDVPRTLAAALERHGVAPGLVEIEVTESSMMGENQKVTRALKDIQQMGVKLSVDDFGTGYSSLSQLQRMDFDVLKVDRAFTVEIDRTERGNVFFTAIITMAHALGMRVVAEGVENERQSRILRSLHCDELQGFYISEPLPASEQQPVLPKRTSPVDA